jgi:hypothetical protein
MNLTLLAYVLAIALGAVCFTLVKRTADEYDAWYTQPRFTGVLVPVGVLSTVLALALIVLAR